MSQGRLRSSGDGPARSAGARNGTLFRAPGAPRRSVASGRGPRWARGSAGQAAVEVALVLPVLALVLLLVVQTALVVRDQVLVVHAAREAARAAAVDPSAAAPRRAALAAASLDPDRLVVRVTSGGAGRLVSVTVSYRSPTVAPMIGPLVPDILVEGRASMRREF